MAFNELASAGVTIYAITKPLDNALKDIREKIAKIANEPISIKTVSGTIASGLTGAFKLIATSIAGIATSSFLATKSAAALGMELHRVNEIFGQFAPQVESTISKLSKAFGYTRSELADMSSDLGLLFIGMNLNEKATAELAKRFMELGINASVLHGMDLPEFMQRIEAGVAGANRSLRKLGIFLTDTNVQMEKYRLAGTGVIWMSEEQGDQLARVSLILKHLSSAMGQAEWAHRQFGGTLREVKGRITEMWIAFGEVAKPVWTIALTGINWALKQMGDWIEDNKNKFISFTTNIKTYAQIAGLYIQEMFQKSGVYFGYFLDVVGAGLVWLTSNWKTIAVDIANMMSVAFKNISSNVTTFITWIGNEWRNLWDDLKNIVITTLGNLGANFKTFGESAYNWIKSGFRSPFEFKMIGLGEGAAPLKTGGLPEFKGILEDFKAVTEKFAGPEFPKEKLKEITDEFEKRIAKLQKGIKAPGKKEEERGAGIARPGIGMPTRAEPEFVGIAEFGKRILAGGLSKEAAAINTARNTQRIMQMMEMWGPRMFDVMANAGMAMGPM